ncbi:hypothetical protein ACFWIB_15515 [Streptomyces sp. NPDC127051]|uniref:hypothetical protein n=1 Tax=Streptomyces sp. NPDC127051 TaxID=3347119 RepID=UPI003662FE30
MNVNATPSPLITLPPPSPLNALMRAFAVAETVVAELEDLPSGVNLMDTYRDAYRLDIYFHHLPEAVARFAAVHGANTNSTTTTDGSVTVSVRVSVEGVEVRAWALMPAATAPERAA